jgi:hypothetical protein
MICIARILGAPLTVPTGSVDAQGVERGHPGRKLARDVGGDVHHVAVALDGHHVAELDRARLGHPADVVAAQVHQHDVLGPLLGVGQQFGLQRLVLLLGRPAAACPASGRLVMTPSSTRQRISGLEPISVHLGLFR